MVPKYLQHIHTLDLFLIYVAFVVLITCADVPHNTNTGEENFFDFLDDIIPLDKFSLHSKSTPSVYASPSSSYFNFYEKKNTFADDCLNESKKQNCATHNSSHNMSSKREKTIEQQDPNDMIITFASTKTSDESSSSTPTPSSLMKQERTVREKILKRKNNVVSFDHVSSQKKLASHRVNRQLPLTIEKKSKERGVIEDEKSQLYSEQGLLPIPSSSSNSSSFSTISTIPFFSTSTSDAHKLKSQNGVMIPPPRKKSFASPTTISRSLSTLNVLFKELKSVCEQNPCQSHLVYGILANLMFVITPSSDWKFLEDFTQAPILQDPNVSYVMHKLLLLFPEKFKKHIELLSKMIFETLLSVNEYTPSNRHMHNTTVHVDLKSLFCNLKTREDFLAAAQTLYSLSTGHMINLLSGEVSSTIPQIDGFVNFTCQSVSRLTSTKPRLAFLQASTGESKFTDFLKKQKFFYGLKSEHKRNHDSMVIECHRLANRCLFYSSNPSSCKLAYKTLHYRTTIMPLCELVVLHDMLKAQVDSLHADYRHKLALVIAGMESLNKDIAPSTLTDQYKGLKQSMLRAECKMTDMEKMFLDLHAYLFDEKTLGTIINDTPQGHFFLDTLLCDEPNMQIIKSRLLGKDLTLDMKKHVVCEYETKQTSSMDTFSLIDYKSSDLLVRIKLVGELALKARALITIDESSIERPDIDVFLEKFKVNILSDTSATHQTSMLLEDLEETLLGHCKTITRQVCNALHINGAAQTGINLIEEPDLFSAQSIVNKLYAKVKQLEHIRCNQLLTMRDSQRLLLLLHPSLSSKGYKEFGNIFTESGIYGIRWEFLVKYHQIFMSNFRIAFKLILEESGKDFKISMPWPLSIWVHHCLPSFFRLFTQELKMFLGIETAFDLNLDLIRMTAEQAGPRLRKLHDLRLDSMVLLPMEMEMLRRIMPECERKSNSVLREIQICISQGFSKLKTARIALMLKTVKEYTAIYSKPLNNSASNAEHNDMSLVVIETPSPPTSSNSSSPTTSDTFVSSTSSEEDERTPIPRSSSLTSFSAGANS